MSDNPEETAYYLRIISLFIDVATEIVLKVFCYLIPEHEIGKIISSNKVRQLLNDKFITKIQYNLLNSPAPDAKKFDISLLITLLLNTGLLPPREKGWENRPRKSDLSLSADLLRLRNIRNSIVGHKTKAALYREKFERAWTELECILIRVNKSVAPETAKDLEQRIKTYLTRSLDGHDKNVYHQKLKELLHNCEDVDRLQEKFEELYRNRHEFEVFFREPPEKYSRYVKLLFEGGHFVLCNILKKGLSKKELDLRISLLSNRPLLERAISSKELLSQVFLTVDNESLNTDTTTWDIIVLAHVIEVVLKPKHLKEVHIIRDARSNYADAALMTTLQNDRFTACCEDLVYSIRVLSASLDEEVELLCEEQINKYRTSSSDDNTFCYDKYLDRLKQHGAGIKNLSELYKETVEKLKETVQQMMDSNVCFGHEHGLGLNMVTLGGNDEKRKFAEDTLHTVWQAAVRRSANPEQFDGIRKEVDKILEEISTIQDVQATAVERHCIILSLKCFSCQGLLQAIAYLTSEHFKMHLELLSDELENICNDAVVVEGHITIDSMTKILMNPENIEKPTDTGLRLPLVCSSPKGMKNVLQLLRSEKITNSINVIADSLSSHVEETISLKVIPDLKELSGVLCETDNETTSSSENLSDETEYTDRFEKNVAIVCPFIDRPNNDSSKEEKLVNTTDEKIERNSDNQKDDVDIVIAKCPLKAEEQQLLLCTVEITGPCNVVCKDQLELLEMYFENTKRSGGDSIVECVFDDTNNMVLVTFETEEVAKRVEERENHIVEKEKLKVTLHLPSQKPENKNKAEETGKEETEDVHGAPKTIKVKGVHKFASRDTVECYFEKTKRSGGGEIDKVYCDEKDDDVLYITFVNKNHAKNVAKRKIHRLAFNELSVSLYVPQVPLPFYDDKIIIKGLKSSTTKNCLFNFIEAKTGYIPKAMDYHSELEDVALVTFRDIPDFQKIENVLRKNKLEGASLKTACVPISNCIIVTNLASDVTEDTVKLYFEHTGKSGGGPVNKVVMNEDDTCLVYFENYTIIDKILENTHSICGQKLEVKRYQECLGKPEGEIGVRILHLPDKVVLDDIDTQIIKFIQSSAAYLSRFDIQLSTCYAKINWPKEQGGQVTLTCTLTKEVNNCFNLTKNWKEKAEQEFRGLIKLILVEKVQLLQNVWDKVVEKLEKVNIDDPESITIFSKRKKNTLIVVGIQDVAESISKKIYDIIESVMVEVEKEREEIKEVFTGLKPIKTRLLLADKFPTEIQKTFTDLKVKINLNKNKIVFEGPLGQVRDAKLKMLEIISKFAKASTDNIPELSAGLFSLKQVKEYIVKKLTATELTAVYDVIDGSLIVYSTSEDKIQECLCLIRESVMENTISLKKASKTAVTLERWHSFVDELHVKNRGKCQIKVLENASKVRICATGDIVNEIVDSVKTFLYLNSVIEVKVPCSQHVHRLIDIHHNPELQNIGKSLMNMYVTISSVPGYEGFVVRGTEDGVQRARKRLSQLLNRVQAKPVFKPKRKDNLKTIESNLESIVAVKGHTYDKVERKNIDEEIKILGHFKLYDCRNIYTAEGDMTELKVDMLVNTADDKLSLTGGIAKAIVRKGGKDIEKECADYIRNKGILEVGDAFVSTGGNLKANFIVHVRGPMWQGGMKKEIDMLEESVIKCLQQASSRNLVSVAIPAISCGTYGYPVKKAISAIVQALKNFFREFQDSSVTVVYLIDMKMKTVEAFNECLSREFGATNLKPYVIKVKERLRSTASDDKIHQKYIRPLGMDEEDDDYYTSSDNRATQTGRRPTRLLKGASTRIGHIAVSVLKGDIANQNVDVIVSTTARRLDLKKAEDSCSLLKTGGKQLQQEVPENYPDGIKDGVIAVTLGQNLKCYIHCSMAIWDETKDALYKEALHKLVKDCMNEAKRQNMSSIAFPAFGPVNLGFPGYVVASEMFMAVSKFAESNLQSSVKDVRFIVNEKDIATIQSFESEAKKWASRKRGGSQTQTVEMYKGLRQGRGNGRDDYSYSGTRSDQAETMMKQMRIRNEKARQANCMAQFKGLERIRDPKYWLEDDDSDKASRIAKGKSLDIRGLEDVSVISSGQAKKCTGEFL